MGAGQKALASQAPSSLLTQEGVKQLKDGSQDPVVLQVGSVAQALASALTSQSAFEPLCPCCLPQVRSLQPKEKGYKGVLTDGQQDIQAVFINQFSPLVKDGSLGVGSVIQVHAKPSCCMLCWHMAHSMSSLSSLSEVGHTRTAWLRRIRNRWHATVGYLMQYLCRKN